MLPSVFRGLSHVARRTLRSPVVTGKAVTKQTLFPVQACSLSAWAKATPVLSQSADSGKALAAGYEHATGIEREEIEAELEGTSRFETAPPRGPFGTAEAPAIVESQFDERIVGCSGGYAEEEHDVVWFVLKKDVTHDCAVCGQVFNLKVVGEGGKPGAHH